MQTFLPYADYKRTAKVLDWRRLGKQRVEALQILQIIKKGPTTCGGKKTPWHSHPAVQMWLGHEASLLRYLLAICQEWRLRGYKDTCQVKALELGYNLIDQADPAWLGDPEFHRSHQSNLLRKDFHHYGKFFSVPADLPYIWPAVLRGTPAPGSTLVQQLLAV